eukprot:Hpha_TRINITY_DN29813_c0_g1::TRINITY_DN29813_c0_g1_i1::g.2916::m.2916
MQCCNRCCTRLAALSFRDSDTPEDRETKQYSVTFCIASGGVCGGVYSLWALDEGFPTTNYGAFGALFVAVQCIITLINCYVGVVPVNRMLQFQMFVMILSSLLLDLQAEASLTTPVWPVTVVFFDIMLLLEYNKLIPWALRTVVLWLFLISLESVTKFSGLLAASWYGPVDTRAYDCAEPPCQRSVTSGLANVVVGLFVFLFDFHYTRNFSVSMHEQVRRMRSAVEVAQQVADALARYDVDEAKIAIKNEALPDELRATYYVLLGNLQSYKAYLPQSCLVTHSYPVEAGEDLGEVDEETEPPSEPQLAVRLMPLNSAGRLGHDSSVPSGSTSELLNWAASRHEGASPSKTDSSSLSKSWGSRGSGQSGHKHRPAPIKAFATMRRVSLLCLNRLGYSKNVAKVSHFHDEWMTQDVDRWCTFAAEASGVVDLIAGDRRYASFNAAKPCGAYATQAITMLKRFVGDEGELDEKSLQGLPTSSCIVSGITQCGDFGGQNCLRFMAVGPVAVSLSPLERMAAAWRVPTLADNETFDAAQFRWEGQMLGAVLYIKRRQGCIRLYHITGQRSGGQGVDAGEWMYELANLGPPRWEKENEEMQKDLKEALAAIPTSPPVSPSAEAPRALVYRVTDVGLAEVSSHL